MRIKLAGLIIDLGETGNYTKNMCREYLYNGEEKTDITISRDEAAIKKEMEQCPGACEDYIENICIYRRICRKVVDFGAMLIHSAAISVDGKAYLFTALSGTGKTTHINLWLEKFKERAVVVNGDKPIIREYNGEFHVYGTPWSGKEGVNANIHVPVEGICILKRGAENTIEKVSAKEALPQLMNQTVRPAEAPAMVKLLDILDKLITKVPVYSLSCNMNPEAAEVAYNGMCKNAGE